MGHVYIIEFKGGGKPYKAPVRRLGQPAISKTFRRKTDAHKLVSTCEAKHY